jgi:hypothetical protein
MESLLSAALSVRGARVTVLLCDGILPACFDCMMGLTVSERELAQRGVQPYLCKSCYRSAAGVYQGLGVEVLRYSDFISVQEREDLKAQASRISFADIGSLVHDGVPVGEHAMAGALRFYARGELGKSPAEEQVLRRFLEAALITAWVMKGLLKAGTYDAAVFHHGIYVPMGIIAEVCRKENVHVVNWNPAYRKQCFIFSHHETYHHALMKEPVSSWEGMPWDEKKKEQIRAYLHSRRHGSNDWIWFHEKPDFDSASVARELGIDRDKPVIGLLTNVVWDAQLHYPTNVFSNMLEWLFETIRYFAGRPDLQLLIRVHPAEVRGTVPSRQMVVEEIARAIGPLPPNVFVVPPEHPISTYSLMEACDSVVIYGTKTGIELASMGIPVIVAGEAWVRGKDITQDPASREDYWKALDVLPCRERLSFARVERALKYAYHFFYRRMIPVLGVARSKTRLRGIPFMLSVKSLEDLRPGKDRGLDVICEGILRGTPFIYDPS